MTPFIESLGECQYLSPLRRVGPGGLVKFKSDRDQILCDDRANSFGGTILGTSRGAQEINAMVDGLQELGVDILFAIGGMALLRALRP